jgi:hypothetical protein
MGDSKAAMKHRKAVAHRYFFMPMTRDFAMAPSLTAHPFHPPMVEL